MIRIIVFSRTHSIDLIHAHGKGAVIIGRIVKIFINKPLVYTPHGIHIKFINSFTKYFYLLYEKIFGKIDDYKIFVSQSELNYARSLNMFCDGNYTIINNSVMDKSKRMIIQNQLIVNKNLGIKNNRKNIISISRLVDQKNIYEIFKIAKNLQLYNFLVLGDGYLYKELKKFLIQQNINNVYLFGNTLDIFKYLYSSELFLSTSFYEGHPISILEAMSIGLPIVATNVVGNCDTFKDKSSGFYYELGDVNSACNFIKLILNNQNIYFSFSKESQKYQRRQFSLVKMKSEYMNLYRKILNSKFNLK